MGEKISLIQALRNAAKTVPLCKHAADHIIELKAQVEAAKNCQRYDQGEHRGYALGNALMEKCGDGDYVLFDDLEAALQQENDDE